MLVTALQGEIGRQKQLLAEYKRVAAAKLEARRQRNETRRQAQMEARRAAFLAKEAAVERHLLQRHEVRGPIRE